MAAAGGAASRVEPFARCEPPAVTGRARESAGGGVRRTVRRGRRGWFRCWGRVRRLRPRPALALRLDRARGGRLLRVPLPAAALSARCQRGPRGAPRCAAGAEDKTPLRDQAGGPDVVRRLADAPGFTMVPRRGGVARPLGGGAPGGDAWGETPTNASPSPQPGSLWPGEAACSEESPIEGMLKRSLSGLTVL